jgi:twitching motility protein PilT
MSVTVDEKAAANRDKINGYLARLAQLEPGVSDIHIATGCIPLVRANGELKRVGDKRLGPMELDAILDAILPWDSVRDELRHRTRHEVDFSYGIPGVARFRVNVFFQRNHPALVMRQISNKVPTIEQLGLPGVLRSITQNERGMVLVTGVTGSGKSSTLAALLDHINSAQNKNIITIEDPIEFIHQDKRSAVRQREIGTDSASFANALRAALRQDPDVILVGEMRDTETIEIAIRAAETGHLVFSTLHTQSAGSTINRIIDVFDPHQQHQIRLQLSENIQAIISQRLLPRKNQSGRVAAIEVMIATNRIREYIARPEKTSFIINAIEEGREQYGMQSFDQHLRDLFKRDLIDLETMLKAATRPSDLVLKLRSEGYQIDPAALAGTSAGEPDSGQDEITLG